MTLLKRSVAIFFIILPSLLFGQKKAVDTLDFNAVEWSENYQILYRANPKTPFTGICSNGNYQFSRFVNGLMVGETSYYPNGQMKSEGKISKRLKQGIWTEWYENGNKKTQGKYVDEQLVGVCISWWENGQKALEIKFKGLLPADIQEWDSLGKDLAVNRASIDILNTEAKGYTNPMKVYWENEYDTSVDKEKYSGHVVGRLSNGRKHAEYTLVKGRRNGVYTEWNEDGYKIKEETYANGNLERWSEFETNGDISEQGYVSDGMKVYSQFTYHSNGKLKTEQKYIHGSNSPLAFTLDQVADLGWYANGQQHYEHNYERGPNQKIPTGTWISWYQNGEIKTKETYTNGKASSQAYYPTEDEIRIKEEEEKNEKSRGWNKAVETILVIVFGLIMLGLIVLLRKLIVLKEKSVGTYLLIVIIVCILLIMSLTFLILYALSGWRPNA